jgi:glycosyltransferase involved in cell wall biosynthesis
VALNGMRILLLTGIWPPDVGGPATHGPDVARFLMERGHAVRALTMGDGEPTDRPCPVDVVPRSLPFPVRYGLLAARGARAARSADVVYATATYAAAAAAVTVARVPLVAKLVSDPAYERAVRYGAFTGTVEDFQTASGAQVEALRLARTTALGRARTIVVPSAYLAGIAAGWGLEAERLLVLPNPAPAVEGLAPKSLPSGTFVFAGRLTAQKGLRTGLEAVAGVPGASLVLVGDGPEREELERLAAELEIDGRVRFLGARPREETIRFLAGAYAALLPSEWENLPHAAVEALAVGTPVLATDVGGVPEVVRDGENGLLVRAGDADGLADAIRRLLGDPELRDRLAAAAAPSVASLSRDAVYGRLEQLLVEAAA